MSKTMHMTLALSAADTTSRHPATAEKRITIKASRDSEVV